MSADDILDPDECPFSEAEIVAALQLLPGAPELAAFGPGLADGLRQTYAERVRAQEAIARGSRDLDEINYGVLVIPYEIFGLLAELSPAHAARVERWRGAARASRRAQRVAQAMHGAGLDPRGVPTPSVLAQLDEEDGAEDEEWNRMRQELRAQCSAARRESAPRAAT